MNYEERDKKIEARIKDRDLSINVSWSLNCSTQLASALINKDSDPDKVMAGVEDYANQYLELYQKMRREQARKQIEKEEAPKDIGKMKTADKLNL